jgi:glycosyltransferase involved in cell wall biosynthesis
VSPGFRAQHLARADTVTGSVWAKFAATRAWSNRVLRELEGKTISCVSCHAVSLLPLCVKLARRHRAKLVYECHELETETATLRGVRKVLTKLVEKHHIRTCDQVVVVNESIAQWYRDAYPAVKPFVARNLPAAQTHRSAPSPKLRSALCIPEGEIIWLTQGRLTYGRSIEGLIETFRLVGPGHHLVFMGDGPKVSLIHAAKGAQIHHLPPVPGSEVVEMTSGADVGISMIEPIALSYRYALPNKFFEFLRAGIPVLSNDLVEQTKIIEKYDCGWIQPETGPDLARWINGITRSDISAKHPGVHQASDDLTWEKESEVILQTYAAALGVEVPRLVSSAP